MLNGYRKGVITEERLQDALRRILGLKAKLNLHIKQAEGTLLKSADELAIIGCENTWLGNVKQADKAITLLKDTQKNLPISHKPIAESVCIT